MRGLTPAANLGKRRFAATEIPITVAILLCVAYLAVSTLAADRTRSACFANVRALGLAAFAYGNDYDGFLPPYFNDRPGTSICWPEEFPDGLPKGASRSLCSPENLQSALLPFVTNHRDVWFCPNDQYAGQNVEEWNVNHSRSSYLFVMSLGSPENYMCPVNIDGTERSRVGRVTMVDPSSFAIVSDANGLYLKPCAFFETSASSTIPGGGEHTGGNNAFYLDGHCRRVPPRCPSASPTVRGKGVLELITGLLTVALVGMVIGRVRRKRLALH